VAEPRMNMASHINGARVKRELPEEKAVSQVERAARKPEKRDTLSKRFKV
jgi:hypothetical protein